MNITAGQTTYEITAANVERCEGIVCRYTVKATRKGETPALYHDLTRYGAAEVLQGTYFFAFHLAEEALNIASEEADIASKVAFLQGAIDESIDAAKPVPAAYLQPMPKQTVTLRRVSAEYPWVAYLNGSSIATLNDSWVESAEHMSDKGYIVEVCVASTSPNGLWDCTCAECEALQRAADDENDPEPGSPLGVHLKWIDADAAEYDARDGSHRLDY